MVKIAHPDWLICVNQLPQENEIFKTLVPNCNGVHLTYKTMLCHIDYKNVNTHIRNILCVTDENDKYEIQLKFIKYLNKITCNMKY